MTIELVVNPKEVFKSSEISFKPIPVMQYRPDFKAEVKRFGKTGLRNMYYDMLLIREFETMLNLIKTQGVYQGIEYNHPGPAHLSIGQEAAAVGQAANRLVHVLIVAVSIGVERHIAAKRLANPRNDRLGPAGRTSGIQIFGHEHQRADLDRLGQAGPDSAGKPGLRGRGRNPQLPASPF